MVGCVDPDCLRWGVDGRCFFGAGPGCDDEGDETEDVEAALSSTEEDAGIDRSSTNGLLDVDAPLVAGDEGML